MADPQQCHGDGDEEKRNNSGMNIDVVTKLGPHDVLMGRGTPAMAHKGNIQFRHLVSSRKLAYVETLRRREKDDIAREIVKTVKSRNGLFLRKMDSSMLRTVADSAADNAKEQQLAGISKYSGTLWMTVPDEAVLLKVKQALRDENKSQQQQEAPCPRRKRRLVEAEEPTTNTKCQETAAFNRNAAAAAANAPYLQQLVADTLQQYQEQCRKRSRLSNQQKSHMKEHPQFNLAHCCSQPIEEAATQAHPVPPMSLDITVSSSPPSSPLIVNKTPVQGLDILKKAAMLLEGEGR